jgi:hypothetical protein
MREENWNWVLKHVVEGIAYTNAIMRVVNLGMRSCKREG